MRINPLLAIPLCILFLSFECTAQSSAIIERLKKSGGADTVFYLPANTKLEEMAWRDRIYRFDSFEVGRITLATGFSPPEQLRMNYNQYFMQMDYISSKGDTLQVQPPTELKLISIDTHIFYYDRKAGYIEVIQQLPVALGVRTIMKSHVEYSPGEDMRKTGSAPFAVEDQRGTTIAHDRYYIKGSDYFFIGKDNKVYKALQEFVLKLFREHKKVVKQYIDEHKVDFSKREQLMDLLKFCNGLEKQSGK